MSACVGGRETETPSGSPAGAGSIPEQSTLPTSTADLPGGDTFTLVPPPLPADPGYGSRLGQYAKFVLRGALVPLGSIEHLEWMAACMEYAGFEVEIMSEDGAITARAGAQMSVFQEVLAACDEAAFEAGLVPRPQPPDEERLAAEYEARSIAYQCLVDAGYPVSPIPSKDAYIDSGGKWRPHDEVPLERLYQAEQTCTQDLGLLFLLLAERESQPGEGG
jgi:hypothetical protein